MKVKRQSLTENYRTTADWVSEFEKSLEKQGDYLDNLKSVLRKRNDFSSIEEKMADIRSRAGFDLIKDVEGVSISKKASECTDCASDGECVKHDPHLVKKIKNIINYVQSFAKHRPDASLMAIIAECKNLPELSFHEVESRVDNSKFNNLLKNLLKSSKDSCKDSEEEVKYIPENGESEVDSDIADYFQHAQTTG